MVDELYDGHVYFGAFLFLSAIELELVALAGKQRSFLTRNAVAVLSSPYGLVFIQPK